MWKLFAIASAIALGGATLYSPAASAGAPDLKGEWRGYTAQITSETDYYSRENVINITDQNGRRFEGSVKHAGGTEEFIGVIRSDNKTFYWVDLADDGRVHGKVIGEDVIETCYLDAGEDAVAGCTILTRRP